MQMNSNYNKNRNTVYMDKRMNPCGIRMLLINSNKFIHIKTIPSFITLFFIAYPVDNNFYFSYIQWTLNYHESQKPQFLIRSPER